MQYRDWAGLVLLALVALILRLLYLMHLEASPLFVHPVVDARTYVRAGLALAEGQWLGPPQPFWQPPLYSYYLGIIFALAGENYHLPRIVQAVGGTAVCLLIVALGRRAFSPAVGWLAAGAAAFYGPFLYFEGELLAASLAVFLNALALLALVWAAAGEQGRECRSAAAAAAGTGARWLAAGLLLGLAALTVASVLLFVPLALVWSWRRSNRSGFRAVGALLLGMVLIVGPVSLRNHLVGGEWVLISHNAGINFYIGNHPEYDRTTTIRPGREWMELVKMPERESGASTRGAGSSFFFRRTWDYFAADPGGYALLQLRKFYLFWRGDEIPRNLDPYFARRWSWLLQALLWVRGLAFPFGLVGPLALVGIYLYRRDAQGRSAAADLLLLFVASYVLAVVLFFVTGRYRLPVVPPLLLYASYALTRLRLMRGRQLALALGGGAALVAALNAGTAAMNREGDAEENVYLGSAYAEEGLLANALRRYDRALALQPAHEIALDDAGTVYARKGNYRRAAASWERLLEHYPDRLDVRSRLAELSWQAGNYASAARHYESLSRERPDRAILHARLAQALSQTGDLEGAAKAYRQALELDPEALPLYRQLLQLEMHRGDYGAALPNVKALEQRAGSSAEAHREVGAVYKKMGMDQEAAAAYARAASLEGTASPGSSAGGK